MIKKTGLLGVSFFALAAVQAHAESWDMPMAYPASNYHSENGANFAKCVGEATKGSLTITTHPGGSLFAGNDIKGAVQKGLVAIGERLMSAHANENPLFGVDSIPFLATSFDASDKLWSTALPDIKTALEDQNLVYVYSVAWPPQGIYANKELNSVADLKGLKFRAYNAATARIASLAGMQPVQIEAADLSQALATGVVESFISSGSTGVDSKVWESLTNFYDVQAWLPRDVVFINKDAYDALNDDTKKAIMDCGEQASVNGENMAKNLTAKYLKTLADNGMKVAPPSDQLKSDLEGLGEKMTADWLEKAGDQGKKIVEAYKQAQ
ncbi:TRAP transporter substrate-binding protein [Roseibium litorale]|uniref:TRAP transporter substrate-binding protein n=1 Tax=Roseibium litorale TaxID=2803841 RepID=A0ABR9CP43_9HYPH|nr:TRAP transporter substrate-binding protein [Roseibium litorale]MBD8892620.1 TRAP transporter substrate-binding protein [Roseibium litorale]